MEKDVAEKLSLFFSTFPSQTYNKGDILLQASQEPSSIFYITEGIVRNYWISNEGLEVTLNMFKTHAFFPMSWAIANVPNSRFYEAMTSVSAKRVPKDAVVRFLKENPDVTYDLLKRIYVGMEGLWMHIESLTTGNSYTKLISSLVILAKRFGKKDGSTTVMQLKMNEKDIANYAGISRETASRELQKLKKENLVSFEKGIIIVNDMHQLESKLHR